MVQVRAWHGRGDGLSKNSWHLRLTLRHLRMNEALERLGLVSRVAETMHISQPAVSKQIAELDHIVGSPVVRRDRNRLYLTEIGVQLAAHARLVLARIERAALDVDAIARGTSVAISVGVVGSVAPTLTPPVIRLMNRTATNVNLSIVKGHFLSMLPALNDSRLDFIIARARQPQEYPGIVQRKLYDQRLLVVAGAAHPLARSGAVPWASAIGFPWIMPHERSAARAGIVSLFARHGLAALFRATEPRRQALLHRPPMAGRAMVRLMRIRADLLDAIWLNPELEPEPIDQHSESGCRSASQRRTAGRGHLA